DLANAIALGNWAAVEEAPGVGKKLAQRIVAELKDKAPTLAVAAIQATGGRGGATAALGGSAGGLGAAEAISALTNLGYNPGQANAAVAVASQELGADADTAALIKRS